MEDDDGQGDRADVEDPAGEEEGEEGAEGLDKVDLVLQGLLELLTSDHPVLRYALKQKKRYYLGIFPKRRTPPTPPFWEPLIQKI